MPRRVLVLAWAPFFSGAERALLLTLQSLDPARYIPYVLAGTDGEFFSQVRRLGISGHVVPLRQLDRRHPVGAALSIARVLRWAIQCGISLVHSNDMPSFQPGGYVARLLRVPAITHIRFPDKSAGYHWFLRSRITRALFVSRALMLEAIAEAPEIFGDRSEVLHDCVQPQEPWSADQQRRCRQELGLPPDSVVIALTGQISEVKGIWDFVEAAARLKLGAPHLHFCVLGDDLRNAGKLRREMESRVRALGMTDRFTFLGFRNDAPQIIRAFDIITVPSHIEPLGNATLEAMAAGRPVVGSRIGGIPEMVLEGETGFLVPPSDPVALADAIERLSSNHSLRQAMSEAARKRAHQTFGMAAHGDRLQHCYDSVCHRGRGVL